MPSSCVSTRQLQSTDVQFVSLFSGPPLRPVSCDFCSTNSHRNLICIHRSISKWFSFKVCVEKFVNYHCIDWYFYFVRKISILLRKLEISVRPNAKFFTAYSRILSKCPSRRTISGAGVENNR